MPEPFTPADADLRDFAYMPLDVVRLRDSNLSVLATGDEFRTAVMLWCAAWHQVPAASLPNDDRLLANLAGYGRDVEAWVRVRETALHGFVECSDGRLYHPVIAEKAIEALSKRHSQQRRTVAATEARKRKDDPRNDSREDQRDDVRNEDQGKGREENGREGKEALAGASASRARPLTRDWQPSEASAKRLTEVGWKAEWLSTEAPKFSRHALAKGVKFAGQEAADAAFENWCERAVTFGEYTLRKPGGGTEASQFVDIRAGDPEWNAWLAHYADAGKRAYVSQMCGAADLGKPFSVPSRWPPGHQSQAA